MKTDVMMRVVGSVGVVISYFIILHVNPIMGAFVHLFSDCISLPYFIRTKSYDVVCMMFFLMSISLFKVVPVG